MVLWESEVGPRQARDVAVIATERRHRLLQIEGCRRFQIAHRGFGETIEPGVVLFRIRHNGAWILLVPRSEASDQAGLRPDHPFCVGGAFEITGLVEQPIRLFQRVGIGDVGIIDIATSEPHQACGVGFLGGLADGLPGAVHRLPTVCGHLRRSDFFLAGKGFGHELGVEFFLAVKPAVAVAGPAGGHAQPVEHEAVHAGLLHGIPNRVVEIGEVFIGVRNVRFAGKPIAQGRLRLSPAGIGSGAEVAEDKHVLLVREFHHFG